MFVYLQLFIFHAFRCSFTCVTVVLFRIFIFISLYHLCLYGLDISKNEDVQEFSDRLVIYFITHFIFQSHLVFILLLYGPFLCDVSVG